MVREEKMMKTIDEIIKAEDLHKLNKGLACEDCPYIGETLCGMKLNEDIRKVLHKYKNIMEIFDALREE